MGTLTYIIILIGHVLWFYLGYRTGERKERGRWSDLVDQGKLPKPGEKWISEHDETLGL